jgi:glycerol-3-phosphate dehydrogenase
MANTRESQEFDVAIIGAGINGAVSAAALAARGQKVLLIDRGDFAGFTSQQSSNLVWGGIKYLQSYEFLLVYKLSRARNRLFKAYPNQIREIGFLASLGPTAPFGRVLGFFGTWFYWVIGSFGTRTPEIFSAKRAKQLEPNLISGRAAVRYYDGQLPDNDSRFVYDFVRWANQLGADTRNHTELKAAEFDGSWQLTLSDANGETSVRAKTVVNTAGPFAASVNKLLGTPTKAGLVFSKGIHLIVRRLNQGDQILAFWDEQGRLFYVLPMGDRSMIGTTDTRVDKPETEVDAEDREFLLRQINAQLELAEPLTEADILADRSGVRPLVVEASDDADNADWHQLSRKHVLEANRERRVVSILGGKLTDCLNVGEEICEEVAALGHKLSPAKPWFGEGDQRRKAEFFGLVHHLAVGNGEVSDSAAADRIAQGIWRRQGERGFEILSMLGNSAITELVPGLGITEVELRYIAKNEQVKTREDLLRRRLPLAMSRSSAELAANTELNRVLADLGLS